jgi:hypothetical protein
MKTEAYASIVPVVLALDPGSSCGWALGPMPGLAAAAGPAGARGLASLPGGAGALYGTWDLRPRRGESPGVRYLRLRARLEETRSACPRLGLVVCEQAHHRGGAATEYAIGCVTTVQAWGAERGVEVAQAHRAAVVARTVGKVGGRARTGEGGRAGGRGGGRVEAVSIAGGRKEAVRQAASLRYQCVSLTEDEADALLVLEYALIEYMPSVSGSIGPGR